MFTQLQEILTQEIVLFHSVLEVEKDKRRHIISPSPQKLKELGQKSEIYMGEVQKLEKKRMEFLLRFQEEENGRSGESHELPTLTRVLELVKKRDPSRLSRFESVVEQYRNVVMNLREETEENNRLLAGAYRSIQRVLTGLQELAGSEQEGIYQPSTGNESVSRRSKVGSHSVILNANA